MLINAYCDNCNVTNNDYIVFNIAENLQKNEAFISEHQDDFQLVADNQRMLQFVKHVIALFLTYVICNYDKLTSFISYFV